MPSVRQTIVARQLVTPMPSTRASLLKPRALKHILAMQKPSVHVVVTLTTVYSRLVARLTCTKPPLGPVRILAALQHSANRDHAIDASLPSVAPDLALPVTVLDPVNNHVVNVL